MNHFSIRLQCVMKSELYMATSNNQLNGWTKKKLQSTSQRKFAPKKKAMVTVWWFAVHLAHYSFLNPGKTIISEKYAQQINEMHWKLQHLQLALVNTQGPILLCNSARLHIAQPTDASKVEQIGFASLATFTWPLTNWLQLLQASRRLFAGKTIPQDAENAFQEFCRIPKHRFLCYRNK